MTQTAEAGIVLIRDQRGMTAKVARSLGLAAQTVANWKAVPLHRVFQVARITGIGPMLLRPDFFENVVVTMNPDGERRMSRKAEKLVADIERHCRLTGVAETVFGWHAFRDSRLLQRLRRGGRLHAKTHARIREHMRQTAPPSPAALDYASGAGDLPRS